MKIWHNNMCSKSRCALEFLEQKGVDFEVLNYVQNPPSELEIKAVLKKLNLPAFQIVRQGEPIYREKFKDKKMTEGAWVKALAKYPQLIERPIIIDGDRAIIGRPIERVIELFKA